MKRTIRLDFCDFWDGFRKDKNYFTELLSRRYDVELLDRPDLVIFSNVGHVHRLHTCPRVYFTGEADRPDWRQSDYALTCHYLDDPRHFRMPPYPLHFGAQYLVKTPGEAERALAGKSKFCAIVIGHGKNRQRIEFFEKLSRYKRVDSGGRYLNNIGGPIGQTLEDKAAFLQPYKFNICFENRSLPGYTTEKLPDALRARCVPIYWGSPRVNEEFNPRSFLNYFDFPSEEALIERIIQLDQNDALYLDMLRQPCFHSNTPNESFRGEKLLDFFDRVLSTPLRPVGTRRCFFQLGWWIPVQKNKPWVGPAA